MSVRVEAARAITAVLRGEGSLASSLPRAAENTSKRDQPLLHELCYGTLRYLPRLQLVSDQFLGKPLKRKDLDVQALILLGLYQLLYTRIPAHAAIGESVQAASKLKKKWAKNLINGVLREFQRSPDCIDTLSKRKVFQYAHPAWLIRQIRDSWPKHWQQILEQNNVLPPLTLRINQRLNSREEYAGQLREAGIPFTFTPYSPVGISLEERHDVTELPGYAAGLFSVQDEAAQLAAPLLDLAAGQRVLDACCAPGGKTAHLLESEAQLAHCLALDLSENRLQRVHENLARLQLSCSVQAADASGQDWWDGQLFDRILLDAPCSALGVIRRNPDIKALRSEEDIDTLVTLQQQMLKNLWAVLKPGGRLLYATCSVLPRENSLAVSRFLADTADASEAIIEAPWGLAQPAGRQLLPTEAGHDGFYYAVLLKQPAQQTPTALSSMSPTSTGANPA